MRGSTNHMPGLSIKFRKPFAFVHLTHYWQTKMVKSIKWFKNTFNFLAKDPT